CSMPVLMHCVADGMVLGRSGFSGPGGCGFSSCRSALIMSMSTVANKDCFLPPSFEGLLVSEINTLRSIVGEPDLESEGSGASVSSGAGSGKTSSGASVCEGYDTRLLDIKLSGRPTVSGQAG